MPLVKYRCKVAYRYFSSVSLH